MTTVTGVFRTFKDAGVVLERCARINYIAIYDRLRNFISSINAAREFNELQNNRKISDAYSHVYVSNLARLYESINSEIEEGNLSLTYKSFFKIKGEKFNWLPLMEAFYDLNDEKNGIHRSPLQKVPEHVLIKGLFQLIWNGSIDYHEGVDYPSEEEVVAYINVNTHCPISKDFKISASHHIVPDKIMVEPEYQPNVYLFAPDYSEIKDFTGQPVKYEPSNIVDGRLNRRYHRETGTYPPIVQVHGKIIKKLEDISDLHQLQTLKRDIIPRVNVKLEDGRVFTYHIRELYLDRKQPKLQPKPNIFKAKHDTQSHRTNRRNTLFNYGFKSKSKSNSKLKSKSKSKGGKRRTKKNKGKKSY